MAKSIQVFDGDGIDRNSSEIIEGYSVWLHINHLRPIAERYKINVHSTGDMAKLPDGYGLKLHNMILESWQALDMHIRSMSKNWTDVYINSTSNGENIGKDGLHCQLAWARIEDGEVKETWPARAEARSNRTLKPHVTNTPHPQLDPSQQKELIDAMVQNVADEIEKEKNATDPSL